MPAGGKHPMPNQSISGADGPRPPADHMHALFEPARCQRGGGRAQYRQLGTLGVDVPQVYHGPAA